jgi:hypothetical protein
VSVVLWFTGTLKAVSPTYVALTVPSWALPVNNNLYTPANVLNDVTYETGAIRTIGGTGFRVYRANFANFSANASVEGRVSFSYEVA